MRSEILQGFVLKRSNYGEADKLLTIFTRESGKIKAVAKGIRKIKSRRAPHLELFNTAEIMLHLGSGLSVITEAKTLNHLNVEDLKTTGYLFYISEVLDKLLPEDQAHEDIYDELIKTLPNLNEQITKKFVVTSLWSLGYLPFGEYPKQGITSFVEGITEKPIKSRKFLEEI